MGRWGSLKLKAQILTNFRGCYLCIKEFLLDYHSYPSWSLSLLSHLHFWRALLILLVSIWQKLMGSLASLVPPHSLTKDRANKTSSHPCNETPIRLSPPPMVEANCIPLTIQQEQRSTLNLLQQVEYGNNMWLYRASNVEGTAIAIAWKCNFGFIPNLLPFHEGRALFFCSSVEEASETAKSSLIRISSTTVYLNRYTAWLIPTSRVLEVVCRSRASLLTHGARKPLRF